MVAHDTSYYCFKQVQNKNAAFQEQTLQTTQQNEDWQYNCTTCTISKQKKRKEKRTEFEGRSSMCIDQFIHSIRTCFSRPKVLHKQVIVTCPICFDQKTGKKEKKQEKKNPVCDHENKRTFKDCSPRQQGHYMFANVWLRPIWLANHPSDFPLISQK